MSQGQPDILEESVKDTGGEEQKNKPIRVLIVEDSEDDALLLVRELKRSGYEPEYARVEARENLGQALRERNWDIIVSDYYMPGFSGIDAFQVLQESGLDIPFIIVSGKIGEETAVEAMRTGVQDYIMKDNLRRLIPAVQRELQEAEVRRQRRNAEEELHKYREHLEDLVRERTAELTRENAERKRVEEELRESEERYRTVSELITDYAYSFRVEPGFRLIREWLTGAFERITGLTPEEMESRSNWSALIHKEDIDTVQRPLKSLLSRQTDETFEYRIAVKNGETRWLREYSHSLWSAEENRVIRVYGAVQDITDRKRAEESLRESEIRYRIFADNTYDWEFWLTPDGRFLYTSPSCRRITGHEAEEFMRNPDLMIDIIHPDDKSSFAAHRLEERQKVPGDTEFRIVLPDDSIRWLGHVCQPVFDDRGKYLGTRGSNRDITKRKELEENIARLRMGYETLMRHEIHSLFHPIRNSTEVLLGSGESLPDPLRDSIRKIHESIGNAMIFIDNLQKLQDIESGNYTLKKINYPLKDLVQQEMYHIRPYAEQNAVAVEFESRETSSNLPLDMSLMPGVFSNLLRSVIGQLASLEQPSERRVRVEVFNSDSNVMVKIFSRGMVLPPERIATFFERFSADREEKPDEAGMMFTYAYVVTRAHGGDISIESNSREGTTITLVFSIKPFII